MFDTTVTEAAELLGLSKTRVYQLIVQGVLDADKSTGSWLVDRASIERRIGLGGKPGRPKKHPLNSSRRYMLMNRTHEVLSFEFDSASGEFFDGDSVIDAERAPFAFVGPRGVRASSAALAYWWEHRAIPRTRAGMDRKLEELGLDRALALPFRNFGLSLSDQYWIRPADLDVDWHDINYFENPFEQSEVGAWLDHVGLNSPDNTSEGMLSKVWVCDGACRLLLKGGGLLGQEPYNEVVATALHGRILDPNDYVPYSLVETERDVVSACPDFLTSEEEYIPAHYVMDALVRPKDRPAHSHYLECCSRFGVAGARDALNRMLVSDFIIANRDRHWRNFGLVRNVETLELRPAPIFDCGTSLWSDVPTKDMAWTSHAYDAKPFNTDPQRQLWLVDDFSWLDTDALAGFPEQAADILDECPGMAGRTDFVYEGVRRNVERISRMLL